MKYDSLFEFTDDGMNLFERVFLNTLDDSALDTLDTSIINPIENTAQMELKDFASAKEMAAAVIEALGEINLQKLLPKSGLWAWLIFVMRNQLFTKNAEGQWKVGEVHRWFPSDPNDWQKGQRHLVRMPVILLHSLGNEVDHLLCGKPSVLPEIREQLTSQQDMFSATFQGVARKLYYDDTRDALKRGAGGKGAGSPRRLAKLRQQLDVTWDLEDLEIPKIMSTLPPEFDRFKSISL